VFRPEDLRVGGVFQAVMLPHGASWGAARALGNKPNIAFYERFYKSRTKFNKIITILPKWNDMETLRLAAPQTSQMRGSLEYLEPNQHDRAMRI